MLFTTHLFSPNNTGSPNYNICGQASSIIDFTNCKLKISISDGSTTKQLIDTTNLNGSLTPLSGIQYFSDVDVDFSSFAVDPSTGSINTELIFYKKGSTSLQCTWKKLYLSIEVEKSGYQSYSNVIQIYGYDIGNDVTLGYTGNTDFNIYLINNTHNLDAYGFQTKAFSKFAILRQPFTDNIYFYNLVGTQGNITYTDTLTGNVIGGGTNGLICKPIDNCGNNNITIKQTINVFNENSVLKDTCESTNISNNTIWVPKVTSISSCPDACNNTVINDISETTISTTIDYSVVTPFNVGSQISFLTEYMDENTIFSLKDFSGNEIDSQTTNYPITYEDWFADPATFLIPVNFVITTPPLGDTTITVSHTFTGTTNLITLIENINFNTCHWWTVSKGEKCGDYIFNNCSLDVISIVLQKLNNDKTFDDILTLVIQPNSSEIISLQADGIYTIKVPSRIDINTFEYYSIVNFCNVEACWLNYLNNVICNKPTNDCEIEDHYKFNTFLINAHTFFIALNEEFNFNFIYTSIDDEKINNLYILDSFITRFTEYCNPSDSPCLPCNK